MRIVDVRVRTIPVHSTIRNSMVSFSSMTTSAVVVESDVVREGKRLCGYGFGSTGRYAVTGILESRFVPRLISAAESEVVNDSGNNFDMDKIHAVLMRDEKPGGHGERAVAVGALDMAMWDLTSKIAGLPLYQLLADQFNTQPDTKVFVYAAGGYYAEEKDLDALRDEIAGYLSHGYTKVKIKVGGAPIRDDLARIEAAIDVLGSGQQLAVDANGRFSPDLARDFARSVAEYDLFWYEEPVDPLDFQGLNHVLQDYQGRLATGENLFSFQDARNLLRHGGIRPNFDLIQVDPALSYGIIEYYRIIEMIEAYGHDRRQLIPHGGHLMSLHVAAGLGIGGNESYPGVFEPFGGFTDGAPIEGGHVIVPNLPGIGIEAKSDLHEVFAGI